MLLNNWKYNEKLYIDISSILKCIPVLHISRDSFLNVNTYEQEKKSCVAKDSISHLSSLEIIQYRYWMTKHYHFSVNEAEKDANIRKYVRESRRMVYFHRNRHSFAYNYRHIFINATLLACQTIKKRWYWQQFSYSKYILIILDTVQSFETFSKSNLE